MTEKGLEERVLGLQTVVDPKTRKSFVREAYGAISTLFTAEAARERAKGIFSAAGVAEACASPMKLMVFEEKKGFGKPSKAECERKAAQVVKLVNLVYQRLAPFPPGITIGYGLKIDKREAVPTIILFWDNQDEAPAGNLPDEEHHIRMLLADAKNHATQLLSCAESIETDNFLHFFYQEELDLGYEEVQQILGRFALFRQQNRLEDLLSS